MRIAFFLEIFYPEINGVITSTINLVENLLRLGHHVVIVAPRKKEFTQTSIRGGVEVFYVDSFPFFVYPGVRYSRTADRRLFRKLRDDRIDVLHITGPWTLGAAALKFAKRHNLPVVNTFHTMVNEDSYLRYLVKLRTLVPIARHCVWSYVGCFLRASTVTTSPSLYAKEEIEARFPAIRVRHIYNGIDTTVFDTQVPRAEVEAAYPGFSDKTFVYVGRLGYEKSVDVLLKAFARVRSDRPDARLIVVGDGPAKSGLFKLNAELGNGDSVLFTGRIPHERLLQSGLLQHAVGFVTASVTENQPMTVIESICSGCPIIVADVRGIRELHKGNGYLFEPGDVEGLARAMHRLVDSPADREAFRAGSLEMKGLFDGREVAKRFVELYESVRSVTAMDAEGR